VGSRRGCECSPRSRDVGTSEQRLADVGPCVDTGKRIAAAGIHWNVRVLAVPIRKIRIKAHPQNGDKSI
jgi:hypothetical protein